MTRKNGPFGQHLLDFLPRKLCITPDEFRALFGQP